MDAHENSASHEYANRYHRASHIYSIEHSYGIHNTWSTNDSGLWTSGVQRAYGCRFESAEHEH
jgi:hypothetical protein